ncbi:MAG TPA: DUF6325 family protein [Anaerolineae bacterium]|nr:DUF6325 family protein [Anaerolineae bacterium]
MIEHGPVDVIVVAAGEPRFNGAVFAELERQASSGTIRVLDAMVLLKDEAGECWGIDLEDLPPELAAAVGFIDDGTRGLFDAEDANTLYEGMVPGSAVFALAIEHTWAIALVNALDQAGVDVALNFRVPAPIVDEAFASLTD